MQMLFICDTPRSKTGLSLYSSSFHIFAPCLPSCGMRFASKSSSSLLARSCLLPTMYLMVIARVFVLVKLRLLYLRHPMFVIFLLLLAFKLIVPSSNSAAEHKTVPLKELFVHGKKTPSKSPQRA